MVRQYKRKRPRQWRDKDKRMAAVVRLRAQGKSLRGIGSALRVSEGTVRNDLKRWQQIQAQQNVIPLRKTGAQSRPAGGEITQPDYAAVPIQIARRN